MKLFLALTASWVLAGCLMADSTAGDRELEGENVETGSVSEMEVLANGAYGAMASGDVSGPGRRAPFVEVATSQAGYHEIWTRYVGRDAEPAVDFDRMIAVFLLLPLQRTGGYAVQPHGVSMRDDGTLEVDATLIQPGRDSMTTQALSAPYAVIGVGRTSVSAIEWMSEGRLIARKDVEWTE